MNLVLIIALFVVSMTSGQGELFHPSYEEALVRSGETDAPVLILFTGITCANPLKANAQMQSQAVQKLLENYVYLELRVDDSTPLPG